MRVAMLFLLGVASTSPQESIEGCGGFVSPSADIARSGVASGADLSSVKVQLLTSSGMVKYEEACAPNGYYYIPMYDKGHFVIKVIGPEGWTFSPSEVQVGRHTRAHTLPVSDAFEPLASPLKPFRDAHPVGRKDGQPVATYRKIRQPARTNASVAD